MQIFLSWSGDTSREVARALRDWIPRVVQRAEPFVSSGDIYAGTRWQSEVASRLDAIDFGIICVTQSNRNAPWLNYEAGALAKAVSAARVIPVLIDLAPADLDYPLAQFQAVPADHDGVHDAVTSINNAEAAPVDGPVLDETFELWWPKLVERLEAVRHARRSQAPALNENEDDIVRSDRHLLEEVLATVRGLQRGVSSREEDFDSLNRELAQRLLEIEPVFGVNIPNDGPVGLSSARPLSDHEQWRAHRLVIDAGRLLGKVAVTPAETNPDADS